MILIKDRKIYDTENLGELICAHPGDGRYSYDYENTSIYRKTLGDLAYINNAFELIYKVDWFMVTSTNRIIKRFETILNVQKISDESAMQFLEYYKEVDLLLKYFKPKLIKVT